MQKGVDYIGISVCYLCHDGKGNFLLNKRGAGCRDEHGAWDFGGGGLDFGYSVEETLKKEVLEEYCSEPKSYEFLGYLDMFREINGKNTHWLALEFIVEVDREKVRNGEPHKFDEIGWFKLDSLSKPAFSRQAEVLEKFKDKIAKYK